MYLKKKNVLLKQFKCRGFNYPINIFCTSVKTKKINLWKEK